MRKDEAIKIKDEILKKEGTIYVGHSLEIDGVVCVADVLEIINNHIDNKEKQK